MLHEKAREKTGKLPHAGVNQEMAKPPMARSAGIAELKLYTARIQEHPNTITPGTVTKNYPVSTSEPAGKSTNGCWRGRPTASRFSF
jgi:hypothetical protein